MQKELFCYALWKNLEGFEYCYLLFIYLNHSLSVYDISVSMTPPPNSLPLQDIPFFLTHPPYRNAGITDMYVIMSSWVFDCF